MFPGCWRVGWLLVFAPRCPLEAVSLSSGSGGWWCWWWWWSEWGGERQRRKFSSGQSRCRPPSQRNFSGGSIAPVGETLSDFLCVSSRSDGGSRPWPNHRGHVIYLLGLITEVVPRRPFPASLIRLVNNLQAGFHTGGMDRRNALWSGI